MYPAAQATQVLSVRVPLMHWHWHPVTPAMHVHDPSKATLPLLLHVTSSVNGLFGSLQTTWYRIVVPVLVVVVAVGASKQIFQPDLVPSESVLQYTWEDVSTTFDGPEVPPYFLPFTVR